MNLVRLPEAMRRTGLCRSAVYARIAQGEFPRQVRIGPRAVGFVSEEIDAWIAQRVAERDALAEDA